MDSAFVGHGLFWYILCETTGMLGLRVFLEAHQRTIILNVSFLGISKPYTAGGHLPGRYKLAQLKLLKSNG